MAKRYFRENPEGMQLITDSVTSPWFIYIWKWLAWISTSEEWWQVSRIEVTPGGVNLKYTLANEIYFDSIWDDRASYSY